MSLFRLVVALQLILMLPAFVFFIATPINLNTTVLFVMLVPVAVVTAVYAIWQAVKHTGERRLAFTSLVTSGVCLLSPFAMQAFNIPPLPTVALVGVAVLVCSVAIIAVLGRPKQWQTKGAFARRGFNVGMLLIMLVLIVLLWVPAITYLATEAASRPAVKVFDSNTTTYYSIVAIPAAAVSLFGFFYAPVGIFRSAANRFVHVGQFLATLVLLGSLAMGAFVIVIAAFNPG